MQIINWFLYVVAAYLWADWRNWKEYYNTYIFMVAANFFASILMFNHTLWVFYPTFLLPNHTLTEFYIVFIAYPAIVLLFLSRYPENGGIRELGWNLLWVGALSVSEIIAYYFGVIAYKNNWSFGWSVIHNLIMFPSLRLHYINPVWAWVVGGVYLAFIWMYFNFSIHDLKYY